jgi:hypothetical protein
MRVCLINPVSPQVLTGAGQQWFNRHRIWKPPGLLTVPATLRRCLGSTNLLDSSHSGVRQRTNRVSNWQDGSMALRWAGAAFEATEKNFRRIMGHEQLWMLKAALDEVEQEKTGQARKIG